MTEEDIDVVERRSTGVTVTAKLKRGTATRDQDVIKVKAKGETAQEAKEEMNSILGPAGEWADLLRLIQPERRDDG
jgi:hypothetical protein